jgi:hypothetical protein
MLANCWNAKPVAGTGEYRVAFDAIIFQGIEGGLLARSRRCPEHRLWIDYNDPEISGRIDKAAESVVGLSILGTGIHANARVLVKDQKDEHHMTVLVKELFSLKTMSKADTQRFIDDFKIG